MADLKLVSNYILAAEVTGHSPKQTDIHLVVFKFRFCNNFFTAII